MISPKTNIYNKGKVDAIGPKDLVKDLCSEVEEVHKGIDLKDKSKNTKLNIKPGD